MVAAPSPDRILGDWGTSHARLFLCDRDQVVARARGPGLGPILKSGSTCAAAYANLTAAWAEDHGPMRALLCGMVGSNLGWVDAGYVACPAGIPDLAGRFARVDSLVSIVPGVAGDSFLGAPDIMRGEETQVAGALSLKPELSAGIRWLCLPGTHSKWIMLQDGRICAFQTVMTGELFALLKGHSILLRAASDGPAAPETFAMGVARAASLGSGALLPALFETRSRQVRAAMPAADASAFLSGMLIGSELAWIAGSERDIHAVTVIGDPEMAHRYATAARHFALDVACIDGEEAVLAGLQTFGDRLW